MNTQVMGGLRVIQGNRLDRLASELCAGLSVAPEDQMPGFALAAPLIVVPSPGSGQWLKLTIAEQLGIAANLDLPLPANFAWRIFRTVMPDLPEESEFAKETLQWRILGLLDRLPEVSASDPSPYRALYDYLSEDLDGIKRFQLARRIADVFDQYLVYRADWIAAFEADDETLLPAVAATEPWQAPLWRDLIADIGHNRHRAAVLGEVVARLPTVATRANATDDPALALPSLVRVFGVSALPPDFLKLLAALSQFVRVDVYVFNPSDEYWGDIVTPRRRAQLAAQTAAAKAAQESADGDMADADAALLYDIGNPLLAAFGRLGQDFNELLINWVEGGPEALAAAAYDTYSTDSAQGQSAQGWLSDTLDCFERAPASTLLGQLQNDLLDLVDASQLDEAGEPQAVFDCASDDRSFSVHLCHSRAREIEVLHDQLLDRFAADPTLRPRDILVMVPDVDAYAPYVEAVFGSAPDARFIPYSISDRGGRTESPLFESILALLSFQHSHWPASEIMALLETPAIRARFALSEDGLVQIEHWLLDNGVRWGRDAEGWQDALNLVDGQDAGGRAGHEEAGAGRFQNSWDAGLQRLLLGFAAGEEAQVFAGVAPAAGIDDQHRTELNALLAFVQRLDQLQSWSKLATPAVWSERLLGLIDDFFATPSDADSVDAVMLGRVRQCAVRLQTLTASADYNGLMSAAAVRTFVSDQFSLAQESPRFLTGQVSFCTLLPMRTIPFRSVFLVGMNDLDYPRRIPPSSFDLMRAAPRRGDRSRVMEDRQLFLEALLSARDELYISYVGRSDSDDSPRVPSVLVNDLLDYVIMRCVHCCPPPPGLAQAEPDGKQLQDYWRARFTQTHPLQPFSGVYFRDHALGAPEAAASPYPELQQLRTARVFTFDDRWYPDTAGPAEPTLSPEPMPEQIAFADLRSFMRNPARFLLEQCLGARIARSRDEVSDDEAFTLAGLQRWQLRSAALAEFADQGNADDVVSSADLDDWALYSKSSGVLPFGEYGTTVLAHQRSSLATFVGHVSDYLSTPRQAMELVLRLSDCTIEGTVSDIGSEGYLRIRPGAVNARDMVDLWLHHLVLSALGSAHCSRLIDEQNVYELAAVTEAEAKAYLGSLAQLMWQHRYTPVPLLVATAQAHARAMVVAQKSGKESDQKKVAAASRGAWSQSGGPGMGDFSESADAYVRRLWPGARPPEGFEVVAEAVYLPLFSRLEKKPHAA